MRLHQKYNGQLKPEKVTVSAGSYLHVYLHKQCTTKKYGRDYRPTARTFAEVESYGLRCTVDRVVEDVGLLGGPKSKLFIIIIK